jgi:DNA-binding transcriptional MerR regulator
VTAAQAAARGVPGVPTEQPTMSIGEVLTHLRLDFPDITISKLRFLEAEGLVEPYRAPSGYRRYTPEHLVRLRYVLIAQRDRYLPLRVIREQLQAYDQGEKAPGLSTVAAALEDRASFPAQRPAGPALGPASPGPRSDATQERATREDDASWAQGPARAPANSVPARAERAPASSARAAAGSDGRLNRGQLVERSGLDEAGLAELEQYGLVAVGPGGYYGPEALTIARIAGQLAEFGLHARHLRPYRATADREVGLLAQLVPPLARQGGATGRARATQTVHELAALCAQLHAALVRAGLRQVLGP